MKLFRLQNNTPSYCVEQSRDFQLFCRIFDASFNGTKFDIDSMIQVLDPAKVNDRMLELYCTRVGFYPTKSIDAKVLRYIIAAFPFIIKNKGTKLGIQQCIYTILKAENSTLPPYVEIININLSENSNDDYVINIYTPIKLFNEVALRELLRYVVPAGYTYNIILYNALLDGFTDQTTNLDELITIKSPTYISSAIRGSNGIGSEYYGASVPKYIVDGIEAINPTVEEQALINAYDTSEIVGSSNYILKHKDNDNDTITQKTYNNEV